MKEIWKNIKGYKGYYQISNYGNVKSLSRKMWNGWNYFISKEKILKPKEYSKHLAVSLFKNNQGKKNYIHRLVAYHFIPNPLNKPEINHKDGNPKNNYLNNIEWCTRSENLKHAYRIGLMNNKGENNGRSKLINQDVIDIHNFSCIYSKKELSKRFNVSLHQIYRILNKKSWEYILLDEFQSKF